jgi:hypothetical protein
VSNKKFPALFVICNYGRISNDALCIVGYPHCLCNDGRFQVIIFGIKIFDHTNDSLFKKVTKDTKLNTPEQQLWHSHHTVHIRQAYQNILKK